MEDSVGKLHNLRYDSVQHNKIVVAHFMRAYLPGTCTFIYQYLTNIRRYTSVVLANQREQLDQFPFPHLYTPPLSPFSMFMVRAERRLLHRQRLIEPFFKQALRTSQASLIHAHFGYTGVYALPLQSASGLPLVTTFYGADVSSIPRSPQWHRSYRKLFERGSLFLVEGSHLRDQLIALGCPAEKVKIQRIGVDLTQFSYRPSPPTNEAIRILMVGRLTEKKGVEYGIRAFAQVAAKHPKIELNIIGDGELRKKIQQLINRLKHNVRSRIKLLGYVNYAAYAKEANQTHIFMAPSVTAKNGDSEGGAPTVLIEMQARGLPILSTQHADIPEVVVDGSSGYLVPERNPVALAEKLSALLETPEQWDILGQAGRVHVEQNHDIRKLAQELEAKYDQLLVR
ncbi:glycosyltransferase [Candidatus Viridilinea mediisalina]|uniref:Colanic acid biosynthesis glycosyltransferase WcaL n=1 Tax=Candidatus Viridilinea mediisalina TaxID=2024553 RepID=A0A2A6RL18_9CHLR|nr:glycosyltransferase [Candidatus Viridilinea mediisalina]PDW03605.1 hypothetical protein CJ255_08015 [Candidatus Viridilinea mediisalina]